MLKLAEKSIFKVEHFLTAIFFKNDSRYAIVQWYEMELLIGHTHTLLYFIFGRIFRILCFSARAVLGLCLFEHFDLASDTSQSELKVESAAVGYTWPLHPTRQLAAFPHKRRTASLETWVWECLRGSCVRRQNNCFFFQLLVQKHKIFIIKVVSKVSFSCG